MKNSLIRRVIVLGAITIISILFLQVYWFQKNWSVAEQEFHQTVQIALRNVARNMADYDGLILPSTNLVKRISSNYYVVNFNNIIDANVLEYYLLEEFDNAQLHTNFEYAIYDCSSDDMVYGNYCNVLDMEFAGETGESLPKYDDFIYYFGVKFPTKAVFLLSDLRISIIFSVITVLALIFFIYSIFVMLRQKRLSELQRDFINNMTHEFKTPISSIKIANNVFLSNSTVQQDPRLFQYANIISQQGERLNRHVEKVLSIAKLDHHDFILHLEECSLHDLIREVVESKELELLENKGQLKVDLQASRDMISADPLHMANLLFNLLDNAIKYSGGEPMIAVKTEDDREGVLLTISDEGIGIAPEHQRKLFGKFYRVPTGNVHNVKGFGLGLYYVGRIVRKHGWELNLQSEPEKGTEITMKIPLIKRSVKS